ncbi:MAG: hypothetical protein ACJAT2_001861 [Bacteriovoracaceae bacterium]|jgi:hypothetical protein
MALKAGVGVAQSTIHAFDSSKDYMKGLGLNTQFGYRFLSWEISLSSYIYWGNIDDLRFEANNTIIAGSGLLSNASFGPIAKYIFDYQPIKAWNLYFGAGYAYSLQTVKLKDFQSISGNFNSNFKLNYISRGPTVVLGIEELLPFKEMHAVYIELFYSNQVSKRVSVVDTTDFSEVKLITTEESRQKIRGSFFMLNAGITLF